MSAHNLCLHYVSRGPTRRAMTITEAELRALIERELSVRKVAKLADYLESPPAGAFTISFDDAHTSMLDAVEILRELGLTATLFVPTAYVETSDDFLTWDELRKIRDAGWTIGSHSHTHPRMRFRLYDEDEAQHAARLLDELERSRDAIAAELGEAPRLFAYPYGEDPLLAREAARRAGYEAAFTVRDDTTWDGDPFSIPRVDPMAQPIAGEPTGFSVIVPAFDRARILAEVVTRLAGSSYPKDRYEVIVVDDGSREDLRPIFSDMPANVRLVRQSDDPEFRAGQARQRGADEARFDHLAFLDADVAVDADFLWHLDWAHRHTPGAVVLGYLSGYNLHDLGHLHTPGEVIGEPTLPLIPDRSREPTLRRCLDQLDWLDAPWTLTYTGNLSLPKDVLARIGGFASDFVGWGLEDVDLGIRLHRAGARFVFSRFAIGWHIVDPDESASPRNPFRRERPSKSDFEGYFVNLELLRARHASDSEVAAYVARSLADIEETCGRPGTVGIELGGAARVRSRYHRRLHRVQPGGVPLHELLDRVAYAKKVGARTIYLLGGEPTEHPAFFDLLRAAASTVSWVSMQSLVYPFEEATLARRCRDAGLRGVVAMIEHLDAAILRGLDALAANDVELSAHVVVTRESAQDLDRTRAELERRNMKIVEATVTEPDLAALIEDPRLV